MVVSSDVAGLRGWGYLPGVSVIVEDRTNDPPHEQWLARLDVGAGPCQLSSHISLYLQKKEITMLVVKE